MAAITTIAFLAALLVLFAGGMLLDSTDLASDGREPAPPEEGRVEPHTPGAGGLPPARRLDHCARPQDDDALWWRDWWIHAQP